MSDKESEAPMIQSPAHFTKAIASEAMRLMDEEALSMDQAFTKAKQDFAGVPCYEAPTRAETVAFAVPAATD